MRQIGNCTLFLLPEHAPALVPVPVPGDERHDEQRVNSVSFPLRDIELSRIIQCRQFADPGMP